MKKNKLFQDIKIGSILIEVASGQTVLLLKHGKTTIQLFDRHMILFNSRYDVFPYHNKEILKYYELIWEPS